MLPHRWVNGPSPLSKLTNNGLSVWTPPLVGAGAGWTAARALASVRAKFAVPADKSVLAAPPTSAPL